ncbi:MAG: RdgB/HAM1 family non-canonical purine NTP pyrophosphatase [Proteobacteria bacterium]|nr:RdgB/HAM1 family non-canonical purine NTP pyrophosphatase [Pseudomonadota bacterium]
MTDPMPRVVIATSNPGKVCEFRAIWAGAGVELVGLDAFAPVSFPEEGDDYEANARVKAETAAQALGVAAVADDSGLEVEALGGRPGPRSARYGGPGLDDRGRAARLLAELETVPAGERGACFVCVAALALPDGRVFVARGECPGQILTAPTGTGGFGYDPVFALPGETTSLAELDEAAKNGLSHRGRALQALAPELARVGA